MSQFFFVCACVGGASVVFANFTTAYEESQ